MIREVLPEKPYAANGDHNYLTTRNFLLKCNLRDSFQVINVINLQCVCVKMIIDEKMFVEIPINNKELE